MCGLTGFWDAQSNTIKDERIAWRMAGTLFHRGPDDVGVWVDNTAGLVLAHRRLAILDLSQAGHQPMVSGSGRYVIAFNGEIYNHRALRQALDSHEATSSAGISVKAEGRWRGHSDTETLLAAIEDWGIEGALKQCVGMFAFALWDRQERILTLARDRLGEKPLYYGWQGKTFLFGSELKALREHDAWRGDVDRGAISHFMRYGYVPVPLSIYVGIAKLPPGTYVQFGNQVKPGVMPAPRPYWLAREIASVPPRCDLDDRSAIAELDALLRTAISRQMVADVPLGAFLSGGVDSSTVVALMQAQSDRPVRTFSIGFSETEYDEARYARAVAAHLGTDHTEVYLSPQDAMAIIPRLPDLYDEPFGDSSQIPTHLVAALARRQVSVSLSGDGGDELFGGYNRYFWGSSIWRRIRPIPTPIRRLLGRGMTGLSPEAVDRFFSLIRTALPARLRLMAPGDKLHKLASIIDVANPDELYRRLISQHRESGSIVCDVTHEEAIWADTEAAQFGTGDFIKQMMFHDLVGYLCDDILTKVDRAAMSVSLETRIPMLDHKVVEFAWRLPMEMKIRNGQGKWILRQVLYRYVPRELIERPKQGFGIPLDVWLRGALRDWAEALLDETRLRREGFLHPEPIRQKWREHLSGRRNWQHWLWNVLMFQAWKERST